MGDEVVQYRIHVRGPKEDLIKLQETFLHEIPAGGIGVVGPRPYQPSPLERGTLGQNELYYAMINIFLGVASNFVYDTAKRIIASRSDHGLETIKEENVNTGLSNTGSSEIEQQPGVS